MKGKLKVIVITLIVLLIGTGVFLWKMNDLSKSINAKEEAMLAEERDLIETQKSKVIDKVKSVDIIPLYLSGDKKNVVTTEFQSVAEVYDLQKSSQVEENLTTIKGNRSFLPEDPLWAYNPYGTNRNSMYLYFESHGKTYLRYTISVKDDKIPDFTRTAYNMTGDGATKEHECQITGLVAGETNFITLNLYNSDDKLSETRTFSVTIPESRIGASKHLEYDKGVSKRTISNGLYEVFSEGRKVGNSKKNAILLYDNSGVLRGEIPTVDYIGRNLEQIYDTIAYASRQNQIVQVNSLGQVTAVHNLSGYKQAGEFIYDGYGNIYVIATANKKGATPRSKVLSVELETSRVKEAVNMDTLLKSVYQKAVKKSGKKNVDWVGIDALALAGTNKLLVSSQKLSSIFKISNVSSLMTRIDYIIADKRIYKNYSKSLQKKVLVKAEKEESEAEETEAPRKNILKKPVEKDPFISQYGQETLVCNSKVAKGNYSFSTLSTGTQAGASPKEKSYYLTYKVKEEEKTYRLQGKQEVEKTTRDGSYTALEGQYIYCCSDRNYYTETDTTGRVLRTFHTTTRPYRVYKWDFKGFLFR